MVLVMNVELHMEFSFPSLALVTNVRLLRSLSENLMLLTNPIGLPAAGRDYTFVIL
jgi:hypothetical protein